MSEYQTCWYCGREVKEYIYLPFQTSSMWKGLAVIACKKCLKLKKKSKKKARRVR